MPTILFVTHGTRGDVEPLLAQALALKNSGYHVRFAGPVDFRDWVTSLGLAFEPLGDFSIRNLLHTPEAQGLLSFHPLKMGRALVHFKGLAREMMVDGIARVARQPADMIISHASLAVASDLGEALNAPVLFLSPVPFVATAEQPALLFPFTLGPLNRASYLPLRFVRLIFGGLYHELRAELGLARRSGFARPFQSEGRDAPVLHLYSDALLPRPADWPARAEVAGFSFFDEDAKRWQPDAALAAFLAEGPAPVYIGFGSMVPGDVAALASIIEEAVTLAGVRAIVAAGWAGLSPKRSNDGLFVLDQAPHHALFPLCRAVVHHGGAGTTAAGLRAGKPTLICPFGFDQPFWGRVIARCGLGPKAIPLKKLSAEKLAAGLMALCDEERYSRSALTMAAAMKNERPFERVAALVAEKIGKP